MHPRYEVVTTDAGHHARKIAENGEPIATSEVHRDVRDAEHSVELQAGSPLMRDAGPTELTQVLTLVEGSPTMVEVRYVDERLHQVDRAELPELKGGE